MATQSERPTGVHYALIVFVMLSMILGVAAYMNSREVSNLQNHFEVQNQQVPKLTKSLKELDDRFQELSKSAANLQKEKNRLEERIAELEGMPSHPKPESDSK